MLYRVKAARSILRQDIDIRWRSVHVHVPSVDVYVPCMGCHGPEALIKVVYSVTENKEYSKKSVTEKRNPP